MKDSLLNKLKPFGQEHLLTFWDRLPETERQQLASQIQQIDFALLAQEYRRSTHAADETLYWQSLAAKASDPPAYQFSTVTVPIAAKTRPLTAEQAVGIGEDALRNGKIAAALVAGGQGTRLGFPHPKGMYPIGLNNETLFQIHFKKVLNVSQTYGKRIPYCIMTSPATHTETVDFLTDNNFFGIPKDDVFIFCQGTVPALDMNTGQVLLDTPSGISQTPDGHGGMLAAISQSILATLQQRGIEYLFYHQVDNPLVQICSPEFLGYHIGSGSDMTSQVIRKRFPQDKVGNVVQVDGHLQVIEYSDLPESAAILTNSDGSLKIWAGSIAVHVFNLSFLDNASKRTLPFHIARKKVAFTDLKTGERVKPDKENAVKFERFIFDLLPAAKNAVVVEVDPPHHYAPLKNASGSPSDSPETVKAALQGNV